MQASSWIHTCVQFRTAFPDAFLRVKDGSLYELSDYNIYRRCLSINRAKMLTVLNRTNLEELRTTVAAFPELPYDLPVTEVRSNRHLFAFTNGVYDTQVQLFRPAVPSDQITVTCGYAYDDTVDLTPALTLLQRVFPFTRARRYFLSVISEAVLRCDKHDRNDFIWTGAGAPAMQNLLRQTFGDYVLYKTTPHLAEQAVIGFGTSVEDVDDVSVEVQMHILWDAVADFEVSDMSVMTFAPASIEPDVHRSLIKLLIQHTQLPREFEPVCLTQSTPATGWTEQIWRLCVWLRAMMATFWR